MKSRSECYLWAAKLVLAMAACSFAYAQGPNDSPDDAVPNTDAAIHAMCHAQVALLGENPTHSFGSGLAYKTALVRHLVDECHFNAFFIESGIYDFIHIQRMLRAGQDVSDGSISAAIGGLWANEEMQSLVPFLREKVKAGTLTLGGLDDQLGAGSYASLGMAPDLVESLKGEGQARCLATFQRHMRWQYTDDAPYGPADKEKLVACLDDIEVQLDASAKRSVQVDESVAMVESLKRNFARDFTENDFTKKDQTLKWMNDRDRSMDTNFTWLRKRLPSHNKIIIWAATVHTAKQLDDIQGFEGRIPLGFYIHRDFSHAAFSLAITAYSGSYTFMRRPVQQLITAPADSLEARALVGEESMAFLTGKRLKSLDAVPSRILGTSFVSAHWDRVADGVVVLRKERAPKWIQRATP